MVRYIVNDSSDFRFNPWDIIEFDKKITNDAVILEGSFNDSASREDMYKISAPSSGANFLSSGLKTLHGFSSGDIEKSKSSSDINFKIIYETNGISKTGDYGNANITKITVSIEGKIAYQISGLDITFDNLGNFQYSSTSYYDIFQRNDHITLSNGSDIVSAGTGNDIIEGRSGNDSLSGDFGHDKIYGGWGNDILHGGKAWTYLDDRQGNHLYGNEGNDRLYAADGADFLYGGEGNDRLVGARGSDILYGENGNDALYAYEYYSENGFDSHGGFDSYTINSNGDYGSDRLYGGNGNDSLHAGLDKDILYGDGGNDILYADFYGNTTMVGGSGNDRFVFMWSSVGSDWKNHDIIMDFKVGDKINLSYLKDVDNRGELSIIYNATQKAYIVQDNPISYADDLHITVYSDHKLTATDFIF